MVNSVIAVTNKNFHVLPTGELLALHMETFHCDDPVENYIDPAGSWKIPRLHPHYLDPGSLST